MNDSPPGFPDPESLCEVCGYRLQGLAAAGDCPECGEPVAASSPTHRIGPAWQTRPSLKHACHIVMALSLTPKRFFRRMRADGSNHTARLFLLLVALLIGLGWGAWAWAAWAVGITLAVVHGVSVGVTVLLLSYIEALGVTVFSRRRDWRVGYRLAERLVCYSSIAWVPAAAVMAVAYGLVRSGRLDRWMARLLGAWEPWQSLALLVLIAATVMLWFEVLVWIGVRQVKHANRCAESPPPASPREMVRDQC